MFMKKFYLTLLSAMMAVFTVSAFDLDLTLAAYPSSPYNMEVEGGATVEANNENAQLAEPGYYFFIAAIVPYPSSETNYGIIRFLDADHNELPTLPEIHLFSAGTKFGITRANVEDVRKIAYIHGEKIKLQSVSIRHDDIVGVTISPTTATMKVGETMSILAAPIPGNVFVTLDWESSDEEVATVDQEGNVTAIAIGEVEITAYAGAQYSSCIITVEENEGGDNGGDVGSVSSVVTEIENANVYNTQGSLVLRNANADALRSLIPGIYIVNGKKIVVR